MRRYDRTLQNETFIWRNLPPETVGSVSSIIESGDCQRHLEYLSVLLYSDRKSINILNTTVLTKYLPYLVLPTCTYTKYQERVVSAPHSARLISCSPLKNCVLSQKIRKLISPSMLFEFNNKIARQDLFI